MACTGDPSAGAFGRMLIEPGAAPHTFDGSSIRLDFLVPETMQKHGRLIGLLEDKSSDEPNGADREDGIE